MLCLLKSNVALLKDRCTENWKDYKMTITSVRKKENETLVHLHGICVKWKYKLTYMRLA